MRRGTVWLGELEESAEDGSRIFSGRFRGHHDDGEEELGVLEDAEPAAAIAWGRARAERVWIRLADSGYFAAGAQEGPETPRWEEGRTVPRRRPAGEEWRDRRPTDPPITWSVYVDIHPFAHEPLDDADAVIAGVARAVGAVRWTAGTVILEDGSREGGWFGWTSYPGMPDDDLTGMALMPATGTPQPEGFIGYRGEYRLEIETDAPTALEAMRATAGRCADPRWGMAVMSRPKREP